MTLSNDVTEILAKSISYSIKNGLEYVTPEVILLQTCENETFMEAFQDCDGSVQELAEDLRQNISENVFSGPDVNPGFSTSTEMLLAFAEQQAYYSDRDQIGLTQLVHSIFQLKDSYAAYYILKQDVEEVDLLRSLILEEEDISGTDENDFADDDYNDDYDEDYDEDNGGNRRNAGTGSRIPDPLQDMDKKEKRHHGWEQYAPCLNDRLEDVNPLIGREAELERTIQILCRKDKNNPLHIGEPGVGKTAIIYGLARLINEEKVPEQLIGARIFSVDLGGMLAGTHYRGDFEKRFKKVLREVEKEEKPIIYIDEIHNLYGAGATGEGSYDAANMLKPYLADGHIRFIGATTFEEYKKYFEKSKSLVRRFQNVEISEPTEAQTVEILEGLRERYEDFHNVKYADGILEYAVHMAKKYINERFLPDKAIDLIDEAGAYMKLHPHAGEEGLQYSEEDEEEEWESLLDSIEELWEGLQDTEEEEWEISQDTEEEEWEGLQDSEEEEWEGLQEFEEEWEGLQDSEEEEWEGLQEFEEEEWEGLQDSEEEEWEGLHEFEEEWEGLQDTEEEEWEGLQEFEEEWESLQEFEEEEEEWEGLQDIGEEELIVDKNIINKVLTDICRVPIETVETDGTEGLAHLEENLKKQIFGQDEAITQVTNAVKFSKAGLLEDGKPLASLLFVGPTGVGKTEIARKLAEMMGVKLIRFDMSEYEEKYAVSKLIGASAGYVGYENGGLLTEAVRRNPSAVLLLDEIEKAHEDIYNILLQVMDYATLTDNQGRKADFRNVIIIMTSNIGADKVGKNTIGFHSERKDKSVMMEDIKKNFKPEFRNRLSRIVIFNSMDDEMAESIIRKKLSELSEMLRVKNISLEVDDKAFRLIKKKGINEEYGAREVERVIRNEIKPLFVDSILFGELRNGGSIRLTTTEVSANVNVDENVDVSADENAVEAEFTVETE